MSIRCLGDTSAAARLSALRFSAPVAEVAAALAEWECARNGLLVPIQMPFPKRQDPENSDGEPKAKVFTDRARQMREMIAAALNLDQDAASRLTFTMTPKEAWYLGPRPNLSRDSMMAAARSSPEKFIELMLQKEFIEDAAFSPDHIFVSGGFGPGVYLSSLSQNSKNRAHLAEVKFSVNKKHGILLCDIASKVFARKTKSPATSPSKSTLAIDVGDGYMLGVSRLVPGDFFEIDARQYPMTGISLDTIKMRQSRLYFLNVVTEFAIQLFRKAGIQFQSETFTATHCIDDGYIPLEALAQLTRPLVIVSDAKLPADKAVPQLHKFLEAGYHVAANKKVHFNVPDIRVVTEVPESPSPEINYLFLNGKGDDENGSVTIAKKSLPAQVKSVRPRDAYEALASGEAVADPYTEYKYRNLMALGTATSVMQGLDCGIEQLLDPASVENDKQLTEALKRCLVELSLKECLVGAKSIPMKGVAPASLTVLATRQIFMSGRRPNKQLVSAVDIEITDDGISVSKVRRSPWATDIDAAIEFTSEFEFLMTDPKKPIRDGQFWVLDRTTGQRLTVWAGSFVPKIILNNRYPGIEAALADQEPYLRAQRMKLRPNGTTGQGKFYSKSREYNLLPYYMSIFRPEHQTRGERNGVRIPLEDKGGFLRVFVPPEGGIAGKGDALSTLRDVMLYEFDGTPVADRLLENQLVQIYLHSLTNGILVGGDNSKMSIFEKLARLALEN